MCRGRVRGKVTMSVRSMECQLIDSELGRSARKVGYNDSQARAIRSFTKCVFYEDEEEGLGRRGAFLPPKWRGSARVDIQYVDPRGVTESGTASSICNTVFILFSLIIFAQF